MGLLLLTVTDVSTTFAVVIFRVKVSCITSADGIYMARVARKLTLNDEQQLRQEFHSAIHCTVGSDRKKCLHIQDYLGFSAHQNDGK